MRGRAFNSLLKSPHACDNVDFSDVTHIVIIGELPGLEHALNWIMACAAEVAFLDSAFAVREV